MPKKFIAHTDYMKKIGRPNSWGIEYDDEETAAKAISKIQPGRLESSATLYTCELLEMLVVTHKEILKEHKKFYSEFMREKELLRKLRK